MLSNNPNKKNHPFLDENLKLVSYCPLCENRYNLLEARVLEENETASLIYIRCRNCQSSILALIFNNQTGVGSVGLVTDLTADEVMKYRSGEGVTENDALDLYQVLQKTDSMLELVD